MKIKFQENDQLNINRQNADSASPQRRPGILPGSTENISGGLQLAMNKHLKVVDTIDVSVISEEESSISIKPESTRKTVKKKPSK